MLIALCIALYSYSLITTKQHYFMKFISFQHTLILNILIILFSIHSSSAQILLHTDSLEHSSSKLLETVHIQGSLFNNNIKKSPYNIHRYLRNNLNPDGQNLIDALSTIAGVNQIATGPAISKPVIRGLSSNRVLSLNFGLKQEGQQWGAEHGIEIDPYAIAQVELIKGPASLMYGSDALAGVLNFIPEASLPEGIIKTTFLNNYQSNNHLIAQSLSNAGTEKGWSWNSRISHKIAGDYQNVQDGKVLNSGYREWDLQQSISTQKKWGTSSIHFSAYNNSLNLAEGERDSLGHFVFENAAGQLVSANDYTLKTYRIGSPHQNVQHYNLSQNSQFNLGKYKLYFDAGWQKNIRKEYSDATTPEHADLAMQLNTYQYRIYLPWTTKNNWQPQVGLNGMYQTQNNLGDEWIIPNYKLNDLGVYSLIQKKIKALHWAGGLRLDHRSMHIAPLLVDSNGQVANTHQNNTVKKFNAASLNFLGLSGSIGFSFIPNDKHSFKVNFAKGYRAPNSAELSSNGMHEGAFRYELGQNNLKAESSYQCDVSYAASFSQWQLEISPFIQWINQYVYLHKLQSALGGDSLMGNNDPAPAFQYANGDAVLKGGEITLNYQPKWLRNVHINSSFALVSTTLLHQTDSSRYLPFSPPSKLQVNMYYHYPKRIGIFDQLKVEWAVNHVMQQNRIYSAFGTESPTAAYTLNHLRLSAAIHAFQKDDFLQLQISCNNIFNQVYQDHLSRLKYAPINPANGKIGIYNMGRNVSITAILNI